MYISFTFHSTHQSELVTAFLFPLNYDFALAGYLFVHISHQLDCRGSRLALYPQCQEELSEGW